MSDEEYIRSQNVNVNAPVAPVALVDTFEPTLVKWKEDGGTGVTTVARDASVAYNGDASLHLATKVAGPATADEVWARRYCITPNVARIAKFQTAFLVLANPSTPALFDLEFNHMESRVVGGARTFAIRFQAAALDWQIYTEPATWVTLTNLLPTLQFDTTIEYWHNLELVCNIGTGLYVSARVNEVEVDLTEYQADTVPSGDRFSRVEVKLTKRFIAATLSECWVDDVMLVTTE